MNIILAKLRQWLIILIVKICEHYIQQNITFVSTLELNITLDKSEVFLKFETDFRSLDQKYLVM